MSFNNKEVNDWDLNVFTATAIVRSPSVANLLMCLIVLSICLECIYR